MNYIILNGVWSNTIEGLLIQSLPPITKPLMRTEIEEIDGRDGDIVTKLGYSAYDKEVTIGLYGNYDINAVISFFDSTGTATFSNEPDKLYYYQVVEQIDFERLVRYRTATVVFHCQPFKYPVSEKEIEITAVDKTTFTYMDAGINANNEIEDDTNERLLYFPCSPNTTYVFKKIFDENFPRNTIAETTVVPADGVSVQNKAVELSGDSVTYTTSATAEYIVWWFYNVSSSDDEQDVIDSMQITTGTPTVTNIGNTAAKPRVKIYGDGIIYLYVNNVQVFMIDMTNATNITIDAAEMNAYDEGTGAFLNRLVTGDYDKFRFHVGQNTLSWIGNITQIDISRYSRWI